MINAAIVGLGWWGKTLVESVSGSDVIRFVAGATRTVSPEVEAFAKQHGLRLAASYEALLADPAIDAVVLATPHSLHAEQVIAAAAAGKHVFCEKPFTLTKRRPRPRSRRCARPGVTLGLGYNRRFHPEMTKLRERIRVRRARHHPARRSDHDVSQRAVPASRRVARARRTKTPLRRPCADGRARGRRA